MIPNFNIFVNLFLTIGKTVQFSALPIPFVFHLQGLPLHLRFHESDLLFSKKD